MKSYTSSKMTLRELGEIALITNMASTIDAICIEHSTRSPLYKNYTVIFKNHSVDFQSDSEGYLSVSAFINSFERYL